MLDLIFIIVLSLIAYVTGSWLERRHFASIKEREAQFSSMPMTTFKNLPNNWQPQRAGLAQGSVVISLDYFKRIIAGIKMFFGGRLTTYEPLLDRARREAILRMQAHAKANGFNAISNVRIETSRLASGGKSGKRTAGIEIMAYGTGLQIST